MTVPFVYLTGGRWELNSKFALKWCKSPAILLYEESFNFNLLTYISVRESNNKQRSEANEYIANELGVSIRMIRQDML